MIKIAILGYGTVGSGVFEVLQRNADNIAEKAREMISVSKICDLRDFIGDPAENLITHNFNEILEDDEISIVVETMGGIEPAYSFVKDSIKSGKSVCTSNKELVAKFGAELIKSAKKHNVNFLFEASVGGGIPVIRTINQALTADKILEIKGILNGTTNYILTKMNEENSDYSNVLAEAQKMGYAEKDPASDVNGFDTSRKIAILASLISGRQVDYEDIPTEGITGITGADMEYAKELGATIKLIGESSIQDGKVRARVAPVIVTKNHPLYSVNDVFNAVCLKGNVVDDIILVGKGAGKLPTASAVVGDVIEAAVNKNVHRDIIWNEEKIPTCDIAEYKGRFLVRLPKDNEKLVKERISCKEIKGKIKNEFAFITPEISEKELNKHLDNLSVINKILIED